MENTSGLSRGQAFAEYALIVFFAAVALILILGLFGLSLKDAYCFIGDGLTGGNACDKNNKVLCADEFSGLLDGWSPNLAQKQIVDGKFCWSGNYIFFNNCSQEFEHSNYEIKITGVTLSDGQGYGVFFRTTEQQQGASGYIFQYDPGMKSYGYTNGAFLIRRWLDGREIWNPIAVAPIPDDFKTFNTPHDISIFVNGNSFTVTMDKIKILNVIDNVYTEGGAGLRSWSNGSICIEDFQINGIE